MFASLAAIAAPHASAALTVVNGDFETGGGYNGNVIGWFDGTSNLEWDDTFMDTHPVSPQAGTTVVWSGTASAKNFLYQPIGTKEASDVAIDVSIVVSNAAGPFTVGIYQSATFGGADGTDVAGASGVVLIDSSTRNISYATDVAGTETFTLSLATANLTDPIFLRFHFGVDGVGGGEWLKGDNITMTVQSGTVPYVFTLAITRNGGTLGFEWPSQPGKQYDLLSATVLLNAPDTWPPYNDGTTTYENIAASGTGTNTLSGVIPLDPERFFALREK